MSNTKRAILRAIAIKLEIETHKKYRSVMAKIFQVAFVCALIVTVYNSVSAHLEAKRILENPEYVEANVRELKKVSEKQSSYRYTFEVSDTTYENDVVVSHSNYDKYHGTQGFDIVYNRDDPEKSGIAALVKKKSEFMSVIKSFAMMFFAGGIGLFIIYLFLIEGIVQPKEPYDDE